MRVDRVDAYACVRVFSFSFACPYAQKPHERPSFRPRPKTAPNKINNTPNIILYCAHVYHSVGIFVLYYTYAYPPRARSKYFEIRRPPYAQARLRVTLLT